MRVAQKVRGCCEVGVLDANCPAGVASSSSTVSSESLRTTLADVLGDTFVEDRCWQLAQLSIRKGGTGIRCADRHASAAFLASVLSCLESCKAIDPAFDVTDTAGGLCLLATHGAFNQDILEPARVPLQVARGGFVLPGPRVPLQLAHCLSLVDSAADR